MKKYFLFVMLLFLCFYSPVFASELDSSKSSIVMDIDSGRILYENNSHDKRLIASITKIMTATIALENGNINKKYKAGDEILEMYGTSIYLEHEEEMSLKDLLYGLMLRSGNDAAVVISNNLASDEKSFVKMMNNKAKKIGMKDTIFNNSHGLDEKTKNYSTAYDMALLSSYAYKNLKWYRKITRTKKYVVQTDKKTYLWYNRNKLLSNYKYCTGGKNGYTPSAGKTLVTTAKKDNLRLTTVSLSDGDSYNTHQKLYEYIYSKYKRYQVVDKKHFAIDKNFFKDNLYIKNSFYYPLTEEEANNIKTVVKITKNRGYKNNDQVGVIDIFINKDKIGEIPIYVKK